MSAAQVTASKVGLLLQCGRPFSEGVALENHQTPKAAYGSAFHACADLRIRGLKYDTEAICAKWGVPEVLEVAAHVENAMEVLEKWLAGANPFGERFRVVDTEKHLATQLRKPRGASLQVKSRSCDFDEETHHYDLRPGEIGGTYDLLLASDPLWKASKGQTQTPEGQVAIGLGGSPRVWRVVLDYKTGDWGDFSSPAKLAQMKTLALQTGADIVAILHAPRDLPAVVYAEELTLLEVSQFARELRKAKTRIDDGSLRPGPECQFCPAKESCPAKDGELLKRAGGIVRAASGVSLETLRTPEELGRFHQMMGDVEKLVKRAKDEIKDLVAQGEIIERPDGKTLVLEDHEYETLSKTSVTDALGKAKGEKFLDGLRKKGLMSFSRRVEMHARNR